MIPRHLALGLLLLSSSAPAAKSPRLTEAILFYDKTEFAKAKDRLATLVDAPALSGEERSSALVYLAASYHALGDSASAKAQLLRLARAFPAARVDPGLFLPELVALADEARGEVAREDSGAAPATFEPTKAPARASLAYAFVPFGVGQFKNGESAKGALFLGGEALTLGTFALTLALFENSKLEGQFLGGGRFADPGAAGTLHGLYLASFWAGMALIVGGIVDAVVCRPAELPAVSMRVAPNGVVVRF